MRRDRCALALALGIGLLGLTGLPSLAGQGTAGAGSRQGAGEITVLQVPEELVVTQVWYEDLSGDRRRDLVIAVYREDHEYERSLRIHFAGTGPQPFAQAPDAIAVVPRSVSSGAIGDVHGDAGAEVVWFGARGAYAWRPRATDARREVKLVACEFLFQYPDPQELLSWQQGVVDLDGDDLPDLLLPEPDGYRIAIQRRDAAGAATWSTAVLRLPIPPPTKTSRSAADHSPVAVRDREGGGRRELRLSFPGSGSAAAAAPLLDVDESVPAPQLADWDADGDLDLIARQGEHVYVWLQAAGGRFGRAPDLEFAFPIPDEKTRLDPRFSAALVDFDRDRRVDAVIVAKDPDKTELRSQILCFSQRQGEQPAELFAKGIPAQLLIVSGFTSPPQFADVDGDGAPDLQILSWRADAAGAAGAMRGVGVGAGGPPELDVEMYVYLNRGGRFSRRPDLTYRSTLATGMLQRGGQQLFARFLGDVSGDGVSELLVRDRPDRLRLHGIERRGQGLAVVEEPLFGSSIAAEARVQHLPPAAGRKGCLVIERHQVLLVRF